MPFVIKKGNLTDSNLFPEVQTLWEEWQSNHFFSFKTSGTTGKPKIITFHKKHIIHSAHLTKSFFKLPQDCRVFTALPVQYVAGRMMFFRAFVLAWDVFYEKPSLNPIKNLSKEHFDLAVLTPTQAMNAIERLHGIKIVLIGGAAVPSNLIAQLQAKSIKAYETFGMTETLTHCAVREISPKESKQFQLLPGFKIVFHSSNELWLQTPYHNEILKTNDVIKHVDENRFVWIGRKDFVINSGGIKIHPEQIENHLNSYLPNGSFYITSKKDEQLGEKIIMIAENTIAHLISLKLFEKLNKYHRPKEILFVQQLPRTASGKIIRKTWEELQL